VTRAGLPRQVFIDWIKHAFVTKFNRITPNIYARFVHHLSSDTVQMSATGGLAHEPLAAVSSRMGFQPIPLLCLLVRVVGHDVLPALELRHPSGWLLLVVAWLNLVALKILTSILLLGFAATHAEPPPKRQGIRPSPSEEILRASEASRGKPFLQGIARYTLFGRSLP
jgi:hypothetical protein